MIFAAALQWFVLAVFCWMLAEFLQIYMCINFGWNRSRSRLKYFAILGWGTYTKLLCTVHCNSLTGMDLLEEQRGAHSS
jgi:hypothetical protein